MLLKKTKKKFVGKIFSDKNITKKNYRIKRSKKSYNQNICNIINKKPTLKSKNDYISLLNNYNIKKFKNIKKFTIYPFCSEKIKVSIYLDYVNRYKINKYLIKIIEDKYNCKFIFSKKYFKKDTENFIGQKNDPYKFINLICNKISFKNHFIISHSNFMSKLSNYIETNIFNINLERKHIFDNLDILQIVIQNKNIQYCIVRRFKDNYKLPSKFKLSEKKISNNSYSIFLMRHCAGCHNITKNVLKKINFGYGLYSSCFDIINLELKKKGKYLKKIINNYGGIDNFDFGSSIIFRSILTILNVFNAIL